MDEVFPLGRVTRLAAALIVAFIVLYIALPFDSTRTAGVVFPTSTPSTLAAGGDSELTVQEVKVAVAPAHCGAAVVDAWHAKNGVSGWFGYAPLTAAITVPGSCRAEARHRLSIAVFAILVALGLFLVASAIDRRPEPGPGTAPAPAA